MSRLNLNKRFLFWMFFIISIFICVSFVSAYITTNQYSSEYNNVMGLGMFNGGQSLQLDESMCAQGTDFMVQIGPLSCSPTIVTSDLLEEENVNVFCKMTALKINPLIDVTAIDSISFATQYPKEVLSIGYEPAQAALGQGLGGSQGSNLQGSLLLNNLGYVVITLRRQPNESALTNCEKTALGTQVCWVQGNLTAKFTYDVQNSFGVGKALFYVPMLTDDEWQNDYIRYGFWDGRGYLRAKAVNDDSATLAIYSDNHIASSILAGKRTYNLAPYTSNIDLSVGQTSGQIFLPGLSPCLGSLQLQLVDVENPDTVAQLSVNDDYTEVKKGEWFLNNKCQVIDFSKSGINEKVQVNCKDDAGQKKLDFIISPKVSLSIDGVDKSYELGDRLYQSGNEKKYVYLGYIGVFNKASTTDKPEDSYVYLVALPGESKSKLSDSELLSVSNFAEKISAKAGKTADMSSFKNAMKTLFLSDFVALGKWAIKGEDFSIVAYPDITTEYWKHTVKLKGFSTTDSINDINTGEQYSQYYQSAMDDLDKDVNTYPSEIESQNSVQTFGERALIEEIKLADAVGQKKTLLTLCRKFIENYPKSKESLYTYCGDPLKLANSELTEKDVTINNVVKRITFDGISEPSVNDYSATIVVQGEKKTETYVLRKNTPITLDGFKTTSTAKISDSIALENLDINTATIKLGLSGCISTGITGSDTRTDSIPLTKGGIPQGPICGYTFSVIDIKLNKVAKVSIIPNTDFARSNSTFNFKIAVEKRAIQLSPEKAKSKIIELNKSIEGWRKISNYLGGTVKVMKGACIATETYLTIKNIIADKDGKSIARQKIMTQDGGWNSWCEGEIAPKKTNPLYKSLNDCFLKNSDNIEKDVTAMASAMKNSGNVVNLDDPTAIKTYSNGVGNTLTKLANSNTYLTDAQKTQLSESITNVEKVINSNDDTTTKLIQKSAYTPDDLKNIQIYASYLMDTSRSKTLDSAAVNNLKSAITAVTVNSERYLQTATLASQLKIDVSKIIVVDVKKETKQLEYKGDTKKSYSSILPSSIDDNTPVQFLQTEIGNYILVLNNQVGSNIYPILNKDGNLQIYDTTGKLVKDTTITDQLKIFEFQKVDASDYNNPYIKSYGDNEPLVIYYDIPYQKLPAVVPLDLKQGWYVGVEDPATSYDASGVVKQFWICNVGADGVESFQVSNPRFGGDNCHLINANQISTAGSVPTELINRATNELTAVERAYKAGITKVYIADLITSPAHKSKEVKVGEPVSQTSSKECTDNWPVKDCTTLFNVCDPVVCPASRCNFGGKYPVKDVVQSGIIGSIALCYPNAKWNGGDVYVPFCLSGLNAGIQGWISVKQAYADCLQKQIDTGETVGICDERNSIYLCEFFWKQSLPIIKLMGQKLIDRVTGQGQNGKGGGEYQNFAAALKSAQASVDYFTQYYAANSYKAFQIRSTEEVGTSICGNFISAIYPDSGSFLDRLLSPDSPFQFIGKFSEDQLTTTTNPPTSHYKVWYHIYAGTDSGVYYSVYLRGSGSSYYQDTIQNRMVYSGYIPKGGYADETKDFTAPSGYTQLCINVNGQEECGFKEVSTSFAIDYLTDVYANTTATKQNIKTQKECVSGTASIYSLLDLNLQSVTDNLLNPDIFAQGIIRTCSSQNPGAGTDEGRWINVGYCDDTKVGCWIDTQSVKDAIQFFSIENQALNNLTATSQQYLAANYMTTAEFDAKKKVIEAETNPLKRIEIINPILEGNQAFYNNQKAYLYLQRGIAYAQLAVSAYATYLTNKAAKEGEGVNENQIRQSIIDAARSLDGTPFVKLTPLDATEQTQIDKDNSIWIFSQIPVVRDYDSSGGINCFDGVLHEYTVAGVEFGSFVYCLNDGKVDVDKDGCGNTNDITKDNLQSGDILSIRLGSTSPQPHSVIFLDWV